VPECALVRQSVTQVRRAAFPRRRSLKRRVSLATTMAASTAAAATSKYPTNPVWLAFRKSSSELLVALGARLNSEPTIKNAHHHPTRADPDSLRQLLPGALLGPDARHKSWTISTGMTRFARGMNQAPMLHPDPNLGDVRPMRDAFFDARHSQMMKSTAVAR